MERKQLPMTRSQVYQMLSTVRRSPTDFLAGGGEMGALMRIRDWRLTPIGPPENWPQSLENGRAAAAVDRPSHVHLVGSAADSIL